MGSGTSPSNGVNVVRLAMATLVMWMALPASASALLVPGGADDGALRAILVDSGVDVLSVDATQGVLATMADLNLTCAPDAVDCWQRVAALAGHDTVVLVTAADVVVASAAATKRAPRLHPGRDGVINAARRAVGATAAIILDVDPPGARILANGEVVAADGVIDGIVDDSVMIEVTATGHARQSDRVVIARGDVVRMHWSLEAQQSAPEQDIGPALLWGGIGAVAVGVAAGSAIATIGWFGSQCSFDGFVCPNETKAAADGYSFAGIGVGAALGALGVGAIVASSVVE